MILEHRGRRPRLGRDVYIAPTATICGDVEIGDGTAILFGAVLTADGGTLRVGGDCVVMENAVVRATSHHPVEIGTNVLVLISILLFLVGAWSDHTPPSRLRGGTPSGAVTPGRFRLTRPPTGAPNGD